MAKADVSQVLQELYDRIRGEALATNDRLKLAPEDKRAYLTGKRDGLEDGLYWVYKTIEGREEQ